ncbi:MAG: hypothetical protein R3313_01270 [Candidatus Saccharimonadales bacterium]|nr:hypothetical protein [Candidatus Saccharimonadales bacterium]
MRQRVLTIGIALIMAVVASIGVLAQNSENQNIKPKTADELSQQRTAAKQEQREELTEARKAQIQNRCEQAQQKIQNISERLATFQTNHSDIYNRWFLKVADLLSRLEATEGVDASQLRADIEALDSLIKELQLAFDDYSAQLTALLDQDCTETPEEFYHAVQAARDIRKAIIDGMKSVKDYIQTTIKDDLMAIKDQLKDLKPNDDGDEAEATTPSPDNDGSTDDSTDDSDEQSSDNEGDE